MSSVCYVDLIVHSFQMCFIRSRVGNLHSPEVIKKFQEITNDEVCLDILKNGLSMKFSNYNQVKMAGRRNNKSAREGEQHIRPILKDWLQRGFIRECPRDALDCVLPLSLADRYIHSKKLIKYRYLTFHLTFRNFMALAGFLVLKIFFFACFVWMLEPSITSYTLHTPAFLPLNLWPSRCPRTV